MALPVKIALNFLRASRSQSILILTGISIAVATQIFIGLLIISLQQNLVDTSIGSASHLTFTSSDESDLETLASDLNEDERITKVEEQVITSAILQQDEDVSNLVLTGVTSDSEDIANIFEGSSIPDGNEIILGETYSDDYSAGDSIELLDSDFGVHEFEIIDFVNYGNESLNELQAYTSFEFIEDEFEIESSNYEVISQLGDVFGTESVATEYAVGNIEAVSWEEANESLLSGLSAQSISSNMIQAFIIISVILSISSVLIISAIQKSQEVGILKAMGLNSKRASQVFLYQGVILGAVGGIFGIGLGIGLLQAFQTFVLDSSGNPVVPIIFNWNFVAISYLIVIVAAIIATIVPVLRIRKLSAVEVISNG